MQWQPGLDALRLKVPVGFQVTTLARPWETQHGAGANRARHGLRLVAEGAAGRGVGVVGSWGGVLGGCPVAPSQQLQVWEGVRREACREERAVPALQEAGRGRLAPLHQLVFNP